MYNRRNHGEAPLASEASLKLLGGVAYHVLVGEPLHGVSDENAK